MPAEERLLPPWMRPALLPPAPSEAGDMGVVAAAGPRPLDSTALSRAVARGEAGLVWTEASTHVVPAEEVAWLHDAIRARDRAPLTSLRNRQLMQAGLFTALALLPQMSGGDGYVMVFALFALLGLGEAFESQRTLWLLDKHPAEACRRRAAALRFAWWTQATRIRMQRTWTLIAILVLAFALQISAGSAHAFPQAALIPELVRGGEAWRLITGPLMHGDPQGFGIAHLAFNCFALFSLGRLIEQAAHRTLIFPIFAASAIAGAMATTLFTPSAISVGASGGILGLLGYLIALSRSRPGWIPAVMTASMIRSLVLLIGIGFLPNLHLDHAGHVGGLLMGAVWGMCWPPPLQAGMDRQPDHLSQLADRLGLAIVILGLGILLWRLQPPTFFGV